MKQYEVVVVRTEHQTRTVVVSASNEEEAEELAYEAGGGYQCISAEEYVDEIEEIPTDEEEN